MQAHFLGHILSEIHCGPYIYFRAISKPQDIFFLIDLSIQKFEEKL